MTPKKHTWLDDPIQASNVISDDLDREMQPIAVEAILNKTIGTNQPYVEPTILAQVYEDAKRAQEVVTI